MLTFIIKSLENVNDVLLSVIVNGDVAINCYTLVLFSKDIKIDPALAIIELHYIALVASAILIEADW